MEYLLHRGRRKCYNDRNINFSQIVTNRVSHVEQHLPKRAPEHTTEVTFQLTFNHCRSLLTLARFILKASLHDM